MKLDEQLLIIEELLLTMATQVRQMMEQSKKALFEDKKDQALFIIESDAHVNNSELEINEMCIQILSLLQPVATDLRRVIVAIKIANDLERIGDYAKNISRYIIKNQKFPELLVEDAHHIFDLFFKNYDATVQIIQNDDIPLAYETAEADEYMDEAFKRIALKIDASNRDHQIISFATVGLLRNIERAGDHTKNICEHVIYRKKAQFVDFG